MVRKIAFAVMLGLMLSLSIWVQAQAPVTIGVSFNEAVGAYLTDGDGNTLYVFTQDVANVSNCADNCSLVVDHGSRQATINHQSMIRLS